MSVVLAKSSACLLTEKSKKKNTLTTRPVAPDKHYQPSPLSRPTNFGQKSAQLSGAQSSLFCGVWLIGVCSLSAAICCIYDFISYPRTAVLFSPVLQAFILFFIWGQCVFPFFFWLVLTSPKIAAGRWSVSQSHVLQCVLSIKPQICQTNSKIAFYKFPAKLNPALFFMFSCLFICGTHMCWLFATLEALEGSSYQSHDIVEISTQMTIISGK